jgi:uncharacterized protein YpmB
MNGYIRIIIIIIIIFLHVYTSGEERFELVTSLHEAQSQAY